MKYDTDTIKETILNKLHEIEEKENVIILHAVESGSRAWGFASPDSDYDVRFIYVRKKNDYLRLEDTNDFIDWELNEVLDINGNCGGYNLICAVISGILVGDDLSDKS